MNWRTTAELAGVIAVIVSLIFVGVELQQNTKAMETATAETLTSQTHDFFLMLASSPELSRIWDAGNEDLSKLDSTELLQYMWMENAVYLRYQSAFLQWRRGTLGDEDWFFYRDFACRLPRGDSWTRLSKLFLPVFVEYLESC